MFWMSSHHNLNTLAPGTHTRNTLADFYPGNERPDTLRRHSAFSTLGKIEICSSEHCAATRRAWASLHPFCCFPSVTDVAFMSGFKSTRVTRTFLQSIWCMRMGVGAQETTSQMSPLTSEDKCKTSLVLCHGYIYKSKFWRNRRLINYPWFPSSDTNQSIFFKNYIFNFDLLSFR